VADDDDDDGCCCCSASCPFLDSIFNSSFSCVFEFSLAVVGSSVTAAVIWLELLLLAGTECGGGGGCGCGATKEMLANGLKGFSSHVAALVVVVMVVVAAVTATGRLAVRTMRREARTSAVALGNGLAWCAAVSRSSSLPFKSSLVRSPPSRFPRLVMEREYMQTYKQERSVVVKSSCAHLRQRVRVGRRAKRNGYEPFIYPRVNTSPLEFGIRAQHVNPKDNAIHIDLTPPNDPCFPRGIYM
jgi:hypothetical protein